MALTIASVRAFPVTNRLSAHETVRQLQESVAQYSILDERESSGRVVYWLPATAGKRLVVVVNVKGIKKDLEEGSGFGFAMLSAYFENTVGPLVLRIQTAQTYMNSLYKRGVLVAKKTDKSTCMNLTANIWRGVSQLFELQRYSSANVIIFQEKRKPSFELSAEGIESERSSPTESFSSAELIPGEGSDAAISCVDL